MNEQEFRHALRGAMTAVQVPPPMNGTEVLDAARRAHRRRRATMSGMASAAAVTLLVVGAMVVSTQTDNVPSPLGVGGPGPGVETTDSPETEPSWPDGQTDRTATHGPRHDKGVQLLDLLIASAPEGMQVPDDLKSNNPEYQIELRSHQAQFADEAAGKQVWEYMASMPLGSDGKWGRLLVEVHTAGNTVPGEGCELTKRFWGMGGECQLVTVGDKQVGVVVEPTGDDRFDQWAGYRFPDGTVVFVAQSKAYWMTDLPGLAEQPVSTQQLAELAVDPKFHLG